MPARRGTTRARNLANAQQALTGLQVSTEEQVELDLEELNARSEAERTRHAAELEKLQGTVGEAKAETDCAPRRARAGTSGCGSPAELDAREKAEQALASSEARIADLVR